MLKIGEWKIKKGQKIEIYDTSKDRKFLGIGIYLGEKYFKEFGNIPIPKFKLGRRIIYGYECWWLPKNMAERIKRKEAKK